MVPENKGFRIRILNIMSDVQYARRFQYELEPKPVLIRTAKIRGGSDPWFPLILISWVFKQIILANKKYREVYTALQHITMRERKRPYNFNEAPAKVSFRAISKEEQWTRSEKEKLLNAIHNHGIQNIEQLKLAVPRRSIAEIKNYLLTRRNESAWSGKKNLSPPLEQWSDALLMKDIHGHLIPDSSRDISRFLEFIANTECHPPPAMCNGVDFKELYSFLSQIVAGNHPRQVSSMSALVLREICHFFSKLMQSKDVSNHNQFLRKINIVGGKVVPVVRSYGKKQQPLMDVWGDTEMNPLKVFTDMLEIDPSDLSHWNDDCFHASLFKESDVINLVEGDTVQNVIIKKKRRKVQNQASISSQDVSNVSNSQRSDYDIQQELHAIVAEVEASCARPDSPVN